MSNQNFNWVMSKTGGVYRAADVFFAHRKRTMTPISDEEAARKLLERGADLEKLGLGRYAQDMGVFDEDPGPAPTMKTKRGSKPRDDDTPDAELVDDALGT